MSRHEGIPLRLLRQLGGGTRRPSLLVTTSHRPSRRTRSFVRELEGVLEGAVRLTRGHLSIRDLDSIAREIGVSRVLVVSDRSGNPGLVVGYAPSEGGLAEVGRVRLLGVTLAREIRSRARVRCSGVYPADASSKEAAELLARLMGLPLLGEPKGGYLEVRSEGDLFIVVPRSGKAFSGPVMRVRAALVGRQGNG